MLPDAGAERFSGWTLRLRFRVISLRLIRRRLVLIWATGKHPAKTSETCRADSVFCVRERKHPEHCSVGSLGRGVPCTVLSKSRLKLSTSSGVTRLILTCVWDQRWGNWGLPVGKPQHQRSLKRRALFAMSGGPGPQALLQYELERSAF